MKCPNCSAIVPGSWKTCRCGYNLIDGRPVEKPLYKKQAEAARLTEKRRKFIAKTSHSSPYSEESQAQKSSDRPASDATQIMDADRLVQHQREAMIKARQAAQRGNLDGDATQILDTESLVSQQKAAMLKASEAIKQRNKDVDATQILDVSESAGMAGIADTQNEPVSGNAEPAPVETPVGPVNKLNFNGQGSTYFGIFIINRLLSVITLGIYYFWAKIKEKKYLYNQTEFNGDNFDYHATGLELLFAWLKVVVFAAVVIGIQYLEILYPGNITKIVSGVTIYLIILILTPIALILTQRFRYSRTSWRGIRFSFRGGIKQFLRIYVPGFILTSLTFGIYYYYLHFQTRDFHVNNTYFGDSKFGFDGNPSELFGRFLRAIFLSLFTFSIYWWWFAAERHRYYWAHTYFSGARFRSTIEGYPLFILKFTNLLLVIFTLGLGYPFAVIREIKFMLDNMFIDGDLDLHEIVQDARSPSAVGEEIADAFDIDLVGMDLGI